MDIIPHNFNGKVIRQRADGYISATDICQACGKKVNHYLGNDTTTAFLEALSLDAGIPASKLVDKIIGKGKEQGTWVHEDVALHLAQWCSPAVSVRVIRIVRDWQAGNNHKLRPSTYHQQRYIMNSKGLPYNYFSILSVTSLLLTQVLESMGKVIPENVITDISTGLLFPKYLRGKYGTIEFRTYKYKLPDGRTYSARLYPMKYWEDFNEFFYTVWLPNHARSYFQKRYPEVLPLLDAYLESLAVLPGSNKTPLQ